MAAEPMPKSWLVLALGDARQYGGNVGYADDVQRFYRYDSKVQNHKRILPGHILMLRDEDGVLGLAKVEDIEEEDGTKELKRCTVCGRTGPRPTKGGFRCLNGHVIETVQVDEVPVRKYTARFGESFFRLSEVPLQEVRKACPQFTTQLAMKPLSLEKLRSFLLETQPGFGDWLKVQCSVEQLDPEDAASQGAGEPEYSPSPGDERKKVLRQIRVRRGQREFRDALRQRYGNRCVVTGCQLLDLLEAAHIQPYRRDADNHPANGLLLRADIHTLFDLGKLAIDPETLKVHLHPSVAAAGYGELDGKRISVKANARPNKAALAERWALFLECLESERGDKPN